ncbi:hypothetical protein SAMN05216593_12136 [Pseudomonas asturiensis]|uniref:Uncharacterized protein n=1 Tax=Pseudomonas asturiensis TaxID=1190415 RepID=A0A1M7QAG0_9PSED|nr:hypothetical protein SAMN05216593_12136 [Pseudomonas asturiensis]
MTFFAKASFQAMHPVVCTGPFVDKSTPTPGIHLKVDADLSAKASCRAMHPVVCNGPFVDKSIPTFGIHFKAGRGLVREGVIPNDASRRL